MRALVRNVCLPIVFTSSVALVWGAFQMSGEFGHVEDGSIGVFHIAKAARGAADPASRRVLTVATFNIHHGVGADGKLDIERVARAVAETGADVVGLQEVDRFMGARSNNEDQVTRLAEQLKMNAAFAAAETGSALGGVGRGEYGNAVLSRFPIEGVERIRLPRRGGTREDRSALIAHVRIGQRPLRVVVTHFGLSRTERLAHASVLAARLEESSVPTVVLGDFNSLPDSPEVQMIAAEIPDVAGRVGAPLFTYAYRKVKGAPAGAPNVAIDRIFASAELQPMSLRTLETGASDHVPLVAELHWPPRGEAVGSPTT